MTDKKNIYLYMYATFWFKCDRRERYMSELIKKGTTRLSGNFIVNFSGRRIKLQITRSSTFCYRGAPLFRRLVYAGQLRGHRQKHPCERRREPTNETKPGSCMGAPLVFARTIDSLATHRRRSAASQPPCKIPPGRSGKSGNIVDRMLNALITSIDAHTFRYSDVLKHSLRTQINDKFR